MKLSRYAALAVLAALAACGGARPAARPASPAPAPAPAMADAARWCAALNALEVTGRSRGDARKTAELAFRVSPAQMTAAIRERCPSL